MERYSGTYGIRKCEKKRNGLQFITRTAVLLAIVLAVQSMRLPSYFTGPVVNAVLILATIFTGVWSGITIGCMTPIVAVLMGIIPTAAVPLVPIIIAANTALCLMFFLLNRFNSYVAWIGAALAKFGVFYFSLNFLLGVLGIKIPAPLMAAFQIPQLYTALVGGLIAIIIARYLKKVINE